MEEPIETTSAAEPTRESDSADAYDAWRPTSPESAADAEHAAGAELAETPGADDPEMPVAEDGNRPSAGTIVIIEDDHTAASYYATLFKGNGYQVEVANDGVSGVDLCTRVQPQVILLDVMMPRQNGILVLQTLRASDETKNTPVVVMSNFSEPTLIKRAIQLGALEYVIKTQVEGPALLNALPRWMNREKAFAAA
ncbi:MAG: response regulator [Chloroflexi bacterium]|nr:MAG: response regulator [Chloroflexota bacterium]